MYKNSSGNLVLNLGEIALLSLVFILLGSFLTKEIIESRRSLITKEKEKLETSLSLCHGLLKNDIISSNLWILRKNRADQHGKRRIPTTVIKKGSSRNNGNNERATRYFVPLQRNWGNKHPVRRTHSNAARKTARVGRPEYRYGFNSVLPSPLTLNMILK